MLSHYAGCKFARLAGDPKKIVISQGNEVGVKKPGDLVATVSDEELAEELVHLWNEGVNYVIEREEKILDKMEAEAMEKIREAGKKEPEPETEEQESGILGPPFIDEVEKTLNDYGQPTKETLKLVRDTVGFVGYETTDIEAFIDDIRETLEGPEGKPTMQTYNLIVNAEGGYILAKLEKSILLRILAGKINTEKIKKEIKEISPECLAFLQDVHNTLEGPEGKPTKDTLDLVFQTVHKEIMEAYVEERSDLFSKSGNNQRMVDHRKAIEMMERHRDQVMKEVEERSNNMIREALREEILNAIPIVDLLTGAFKKEVELLEKLIAKCEDDMKLKKILAHVRNKIVITKKSTDG